jgi:L-serine dehydratase
MHVSVFELFKIGIGPSSSHTVGPMKAARAFVQELAAGVNLERTMRVQAFLYGSLGLTGKGHGTDKAIILGFEGHEPETVPMDAVEPTLARVRSEGRLRLGGGREIDFPIKESLIFLRGKSLPHHPNGMQFVAFDSAGQELAALVFYSVGGGFIVREDEIGKTAAGTQTLPPLPFDSGEELLARCREHGISISEVQRRNELATRTAENLASGLDAVWRAMQECVKRGCAAEGELPGGLRVKRRAKQLFEQLRQQPEAALRDPLTMLDWVNLYALAVNEENAAGGRVVTAPTNGAAGIIPAVLHYATRFAHSPNRDGVHRFLLAAAAIGALYKKNASISGADVGCQGEVGVACSMAAAGLTEYLGGTPEQVENAAEIGMEHNLGLTCDPVGGLVQIPCIERNAMGSVKALNASRMALRGDGTHFISLDKAIRTMLATGRDMHTKYKETSRGGLAVNIVEC